MTGGLSARQLWESGDGTTVMARSTSSRRRRAGGSTPNGGATTGYEVELWAIADALRGSMDAAEYKHVVLGLIFLKDISEVFEERRATVLAAWGEDAAEDRDEYTAENLFWVPREARWANLKAQARQSTTGLTVDGAMAAIERDNPLKDVLPRDHARPALDKQRLGQLIDLIGNIQVGDDDARSRAVFGRIYEYRLSQSASAEGKKGGEFYTPRYVVKVLVEMLEPFRGRVYDLCCGSSGMFVQSVAFIRAHASGNGDGGEARADISIYGEESNYTTWRLAKTNLALRGLEEQIGHGDSFHSDPARGTRPRPVDQAVHPTAEESRASPAHRGRQPVPALRDADRWSTIGLGRDHGNLGRQLRGTTRHHGPTRSTCSVPHPSWHSLSGSVLPLTGTIPPPKVFHLFQPQGTSAWET